jgi:hypothetical protein
LITLPAEVQIAAKADKSELLDREVTGVVVVYSTVTG